MRTAGCAASDVTPRSGNTATTASVDIRPARAKR